LDILQKIKTLQRARGYNNAQLAKKSGLAPTTLQGLYKRNNLPTIPTLTAICSGLDLTLAQFFADSNLPPDLTHDQIELLEHWNALTDEKRKALLTLLLVF